MSSERTHVDYLDDMLAAMAKVASFITGMTFEEFAKDDKTAFAVVRGLEIVGEAAKQIPAAVRDTYPAVPWRAMAGMRDKLTHNYFGVNLIVVWKTATEDLPALEPEIRRIVVESHAGSTEINP